MILFVGQKEKAYFIEEVAATLNESVAHTGHCYHVANAKEQMTAHEYTHIIVDCEQFIDDYTIISSELANIKSVVKANMIIMLLGYSVQSEIIIALAGKSFRNFILDPIPSRQKVQLKNCFENVNSVLDNLTETTPSSPLLQGEKLMHTAQKKHSIAFAGTSSRIGTTTQALQYIKYLMYMGKTACYIELNNKGFVKSIAQIFGADYDEELGKLNYMSVDMFDKPQNLETILKMPYDYFIFDYGNFEDSSFNYFSFIERHIKVCVCGCKANEILATNKCIERTYTNEVFYVFNYTAESEQKDVLDLMGKKEDKTLFANYCFDYFSYKATSNDLYAKLQPIKKEEQAKKSFWNRRKNK